MRRSAHIGPLTSGRPYHVHCNQDPLGRALTVCLGDSLAATAGRYPEVARRIQRLERIEPGRYFDMHGNAHEHLEWLMIARFDATPDITQAIDRMARDKRRAKLVDALYEVLGFVKDPASIPWLKTKVDDPRFFSHWLEEWQNRFEGYGTWEWLEGVSGGLSCS